MLFHIDYPARGDVSVPLTRWLGLSSVLGYLCSNVPARLR